MPKQIELMQAREQRIAELIEILRKKSRNWKKPPIVVIGGYALRAYIPFSRYSRDCDFALPKGRGWKIDTVEKWFTGMTVEANEKGDGFGYLRLIDLLKLGKRKIKIALDFMESEIRGRSGEAFTLDDQFVFQSSQTTIQIGGSAVPIRVPSYQDYFLMKVLSARASDVRDIAAMTWKRGIPELDQLVKRAKEAVKAPRILRDKLKVILDDVSDPRFVESWRGTFITEEFTEKDKEQILSELRQLRKVLV